MFSLSSKTSFKTSAIFPASPIWFTGSRNREVPFLNAIKVGQYLIGVQNFSNRNFSHCGLLPLER